MSRAAWITVVFAVIMGVGALMVYRSFRTAEERPAVQRQLSEVRLRQFAEAIAVYRSRHGAWPENLFQLMRDAKLPFGANAVRGGGLYTYRAPPPGADDDTVVMASDRCHAAVRAGEPWGGQGERATQDIPAVAYVLTLDGKIQAVSVEERDRRWKPAPGAPASTPPAPAL